VPLLDELFFHPSHPNYYYEQSPGLREVLVELLDLDPAKRPTIQQVVSLAYVMQASSCCITHCSWSCCSSWSQQLPRDCPLDACAVQLTCHEAAASALQLSLIVYAGCTNDIVPVCVSTVSLPTGLLIGLSSAAATTLTSVAAAPAVFLS
jgi:hypothetical protein